MRVALIGVAAVLLATACGTSPAGSTDTTGTTGTPAPGASELPAKVLSFQADGSAPGGFAAMSEEPIRLDAFAGWFGGAGWLEKPAEVRAEPDTTYLAATDSTGCRAPKSVHVSRAGNDLTVAFEGGTDHPECVRAVGPLAYLALPADKTSGVRTVNGKPLVDPAGPARLTNFVPLGPIKTHPAAVELPDTGTLQAQLAGTGADMAKVDELRGQVPAGMRGFAFLVSGCQATSAVLLLARDEIDVDLTGEKTACIAPEYFLATFMVAGKDVPGQAKLAPR
jgi:hypothetical protein